jgi:ketosteroid isomerase-like protein
MRIKTLSIGIGILAFAAAAFAAPDDAKVKKEMLAQFDKAVVQFKAKDLKGFMSMYTDDFKGVGMDGKAQTKKSITAEMKEAMATTKSFDKAELAIEKLTSKGDSATTESTMHLEMRVVDAKGEMGPKGKEHAVGMWVKARENWVRSKGGWKVKTGQSLPGGKMLLDGKPYPPPAPMKPGKAGAKGKAK